MRNAEGSIPGVYREGKTKQGKTQKGGSRAKT